MQPPMGPQMWTQLRSHYRRRHLARQCPALETWRPVGYDDRDGGVPMVARLLILAVVVLAGCAPATLPYAPDPQPRGARVSADSQVIGDRLRVEIDTGGRHLEQAWIIKPDGGSVAADAVENPPVVVNPGPSLSIGVGGA